MRLYRPVGLYELQLAAYTGDRFVGKIDPRTKLPLLSDDSIDPGVSS